MFLRLDPNGTNPDCYHCSDCSKGFGEIHICFPTFDRRCVACPPGTYNDGTVNQCRPCKICKFGEYASQTCNRTHNSKCMPCETGFFTDVLNADFCSVCSNCTSKGKFIYRNCTRTSNTVCKCRTGYYYDEPSGSCLSCSECVHGNGHVIKGCQGLSNGHWCSSQNQDADTDDQRINKRDIAERAVIATMLTLIALLVVAFIIVSYNLRNGMNPNR